MSARPRRRFRMPRRRLARPIRVQLLNQGNASYERALADLVKVGRVADVVVLNEAGDRHDVIRDYIERERANGERWLVYAGDGTSGAAKVPILWRSTILTADVMRTHAVQPPQRLPEGAGPENAGGKATNIVRLRNSRRQAVWVISGHGYASAHRRRRAARRYFVALAGRVLTPWLRLMVAMDANVLPDDRLLRPMRRLGLRQQVQDPTHGKRLIDHLWTRGLRVDHRTVVRGLSSDHDSPGVTVR